MSILLISQRANCLPITPLATIGGTFVSSQIYELYLPFFQLIPNLIELLGKIYAKYIYTGKKSWL